MTTEPPRRGALPRRSALLALAAAPLAVPALAQPAWPTGPVRFINLFPPGGTTDLLSRMWCARMSEITGQQFVVENRAGAGGVVGTEAISRAAPDGSTIGLASVAPLAIGPTLHARLPFDPARDFSYGSGLWQLPNMLVVNNDVPARSVPELIALLRANPGRFTYASSGVGTTVHISGAMFTTKAGLDVTHVPFRGSGPALVELMAGRVHMIFDNIPTVLALYREGRVRALATTGAQRSPLLPELPTMLETLPGFDITSWGGVMGPAGMPPAVVNRLNALARQALESDDLRRRFLESGATPWPTTPEELAAYRAANEAALAPIIRASGARVD